MMRTTLRDLAGVLVMAAALLAPRGAMAAGDPIVKAAIKCRGAIGSKLASLAKTELKTIDGCHKARNKAKLPVDFACNELAAADVGGKAAAAELKADAAADKGCGAPDPDHPVLRNYPPDGDVAKVFDVVQDAIEASSAALLGTPGLQGTKPEKEAIKCHGTLAKARSGVVNEVLKLRTKCQKTIDKTATTFEELSTQCDAAPVAAVTKGGAKIAKDCGAVLVGGDGTPLGSCTPLPDCLLDAAAATGEELAAAIYGKPTECGNGIPEAGELCDDGDLEDGDGCDSNCTPTGCGNGVTTAPEECDDANALGTDACIDCVAAVCGDGFVRAGVEVCGDAPPDACANPSPATCPTGDCTPAGTRRTLSVAFGAPPGAEVGGLTVRLDYPEAKVRIPGFAEEQNVRNRVVIVASGGLSSRNDRDYEVEVQTAGTSALAPGTFFTVEFDDCDGSAAPSADEHACTVVGASDPDGNALANVTCSVAFP
jgi:cysteine-rich repeat protein